MHEPFNTARILDHCFDTYKRGFKQQLATAVAINAVFALFMLLVFGAGITFVLPYLAVKSGNAAVSGIYSLAVIFALGFLIIYISQKILESAAIIIAAGGGKSGFRRILASVIKTIPRVLASALVQALLSLPLWIIVAVVIIWLMGLNGIISLFTSGNLLSALTSGGAALPSALAFCFISFNLINSLFSFSTTISVLERRAFSAPARGFRYTVSSLKYFKLLFVNMILSCASSGFFCLAYLLVSLIPVVPFVSMIPYGQYLSPVYYFVLAYIITIFASPITRIARYSAYTAERRANDPVDALAGYGSRMAATLIDVAIVALVSVVSACAAPILAYGGDLTAALSSVSPAALIMFACCFLLCCAIYAACFETAFDGQTPGKMLLGIQTISRGGGRIRFPQALIRNFIKYFADIFLIGEVQIFLRSVRSGDVLSSSEVMYKK